jgi:hypothetical protein
LAQHLAAGLRRFGAGDPLEQADRAGRRRHVEGQRECRVHIGQSTPAGDLHEAARGAGHTSALRPA